MSKLPIKPGIYISSEDLGPGADLFELTEDGSWYRRPASRMAQRLAHEDLEHMAEILQPLQPYGNREFRDLLAELIAIMDAAINDADAVSTMPGSRTPHSIPPRLNRMRAKLNRMLYPDDYQDGFDS